MDASFLAVLFAFLISAFGMENGTFLGVVLVFAYYPLRYYNNIPFVFGVTE
jgi:hypothetical protein|tara:strand:- start:6199 stop:6351 length:153 start_codon:yes stop_codon:yes gene_type:complete